MGESNFCSLICCHVDPESLPCQFFFKARQDLIKKFIQLKICPGNSSKVLFIISDDLFFWRKRFQSECQNSYHSPQAKLFPMAGLILIYGSLSSSSYLLPYSLVAFTKETFMFCHMALSISGNKESAARPGLAESAIASIWRFIYIFMYLFISYSSPRA